MPESRSTEVSIDWKSLASFKEILIRWCGLGTTSESETLTLRFQRNAWLAAVKQLPELDKPYCICSHKGQQQKGARVKLFSGHVRNMRPFFPLLTATCEKWLV